MVSRFRGDYFKPVDAGFFLLSLCTLDIPLLHPHHPYRPPVVHSSFLYGYQASFSANHTVPSAAFRLQIIYRPTTSPTPGSWAPPQHRQSSETCRYQQRQPSVARGIAPVVPLVRYSLITVVPVSLALGADWRCLAFGWCLSLFWYAGLFLSVEMPHRPGMHRRAMVQRSRHRWPRQLSLQSMRIFHPA